MHHKLGFLTIMLLCMGGSCSDFTETLPGGYLLRGEGGDANHIIPPTSENIIFGVHAYGFDDKHILVFQKFSEPLWAAENRVKANTEYFWLLEIDPPKSHGPFLDHELSAARRKLGVSEALKCDKRIYLSSPVPRTLDD